VCVALPDDPVEGHGLEMRSKRRVAPAGRNPTYKFSPPYWEGESAGFCAASEFSVRPGGRGWLLPATVTDGW